MKTKQLFSKVLKFDSLESTNIHAFQLAQQNKLEHGEIVLADFQESGKGQSGAYWLADKGKNLTFSLLLKHEVSIQEQFLLTKMVAVGIKEFLDSLSVGYVAIKWPNDILINNDKIAGVLIENSVQGEKINYSVLGIGLNVNQLKFPKFERKATSLASLIGHPMNLSNLLDRLLVHLERSFLLMKENPEELSKKYISALYGFGKTMKFEDKEGAFEGMILSVQTSGKLQVNRAGTLKVYDLKEIRFIT